MIIRRTWVLVLLFSLTGCSKWSGFDMDLFEANVEKGEQIVLEDYTRFDWDRCFVFPPYSSLNTIWEEAGLEVKSTVSHSDSVCLLAFKNKGEGVSDVEIPRSVVDFSEVHSKVGYQRSVAVFKVIEGKAGRNRVIFVKK